MSESPIYRATGIKKYFPVTGGILRRTIGHVKALDGVDLDIYRSETISVIGESGCGKTTLGRMLAVLQKPTEGELTFDFGQGLQSVKELDRGEELAFRKKVQMIFQDPYTSFNPEHYNRYPHEFSGGQRQRIGIARAIALKPKLIVADEPVSALDVSIQAQVINLLADLSKEDNISIVFIAHDLSVVQHISDRVAVMYLGKIMEIGKSEDIFAKPSHPYTKALLSAAPKPDPKLERSRERIILQGDLPSPMNPPSGCVFRTRCWKAQSKCETEVPTLTHHKTLATACHFPE